MGVATVQLNSSWTSVAVVNWGTAVLFAKAKAFVAPADFAVSADDAIAVPVGATAIVPVDGDAYDQGGIQNAGGPPVVYVKVACGTASSGFTVVGAGTP